MPSIERPLIFHLNNTDVKRFYSCFEISTRIPSAEETRTPYHTAEIVTAANTNPNSFFAKNRAIVEVRFDLKNADSNNDLTFSQFAIQTNKSFNLYYSMNWVSKNSDDSITNRNSAMLAGYILNEVPEENPNPPPPPPPPTLPDDTVISFRTIPLTPTNLGSRPVGNGGGTFLAQSLDVTTGKWGPLNFPHDESRTRCQDGKLSKSHKAFLF